MKAGKEWGRHGAWVKGARPATQTRPRWPQAADGMRRRRACRGPVHGALGHEPA
jgi:hypothetical protein